MAKNKSQAVTIQQLQARVKELENENRKWMRLAGTNRLTGLPNSLMLYQVILPAELRKGGELPVSLACILACPDGLGEVNQDNGRAVGDRLIIQISAFLKQQIEPGERLFHPDGANFAILIPEADEGRARRRATEIKTDFRKTTFTVGRKEFAGLTCSAGVATLEGVFPEESITTSAEQLYQELSDRLYKAKERGGNIVVGSSRSTF